MKINITDLHTKKLFKKLYEDSTFNELTPSQVVKLS